MAHSATDWHLFPQNGAKNAFFSACTLEKKDAICSVWARVWFKHEIKYIDACVALMLLMTRKESKSCIKCV